MDVVLCHTTADFDTLGAAVGATRLYPGAKLVLTGGAHPTVREFLALHRDAYAIVERRAVDPQAIRRLIVVDTAQRDRLGSAGPWLDLPQVTTVVYDHHSTNHYGASAGAGLAAAGLAAAGPGDLEDAQDGAIDWSDRHIEAVGAATTLIVEALQRQQVALTEAEATVMALGIHVDTGSLTFDHTTARDAAALAWLMPRVSLNVIAEYVEPSFSPALQSLLSEALQRAETEQVNDIALSVVRLDLGEQVPGLSTLAARLLSPLESDVLILAAQYPVRPEHPEKSDQRLVLIGRVRVGLLGRSQLEAIDLGQLFTDLGGGGHPRAAAVTLKNADREAVLGKLLDQIRQQLPPPMTARELMSSPVRTVRPQVSISEAQRTVLRYGHSGLCVVDAADQLVGIVSRRDIDIALHHNLGHAPVKGFMTQEIKTITPETTLPDIEALMVSHDVGRLPVLEGDQLVGIVTRTDVLRQLHQTLRDRKRLEGAHCRLPQPLQQALRDRLSPAVWKLLMQAAAAAEQRGWQLYVVGGAVRDLLLAQRANRTLVLEDIDLVVDGFHRAADSAVGVELAQALQQVYPQTRLQVHGQFQTAALLWHSDPELGDLWLDIATARTEFYPYPAANPEVEASSIRQDLYRRDFTINALAVQLTAPRAGRLLDFFGGRPDLDQGLMRVLHANSFIEDPTRIFRAVRFAVRLGFQIEAQTEGYIRHAIASGIYQRVQAKMEVTPALQTRLRRELKYVLEAPYWRSAVQMLGDLDALQCLHPALALSPDLWRQLRLAHQGLTRFDHSRQLDHWQVLLEVLLAHIPPSERRDVAAHLQLPAAALERLQHLGQAEAHLAQALRSGLRPSEACAQLRPHGLAMLALVCARASRPVRRLIWRYLTVWANLDLPLDGNDLKEMGYKPGIQFKTMLNQLRDAVLDGEVVGEAQARQFICDRFPRELS